jgi:hypothetical protein
MCVPAIAGIPLEYVHGVQRDPATGLITVVRRVPGAERFTRPVAERLHRFVRLMLDAGLPIDAILTLGSYNCRCVAGSPALSEHATGTAIDIAGVRWRTPGPAGARVRETLVHNFRDPAERQLLRRIGACLRVVFPAVLDYNYNAAHHDHFHCDLNRGRGRALGSATAVAVQEALAALGQPVPPSRRFDPPTMAAFGAIVGAQPAALAGPHLNAALDRFFQIVARGGGPAAAPGSMRAAAGAEAPALGEPAVQAPRLVARCYQLRLTVPRTYEELEAVVERWIATCVQSRTIVRGAPAHRERELVRGNPTLRDVWEKIRDAAGQTSTIRAEYVGGPTRVDSVRFSVPVAVYNFDPHVITAAPCRPDTVDRIVRSALQLLPSASQHGITLSANQTRRIRCWLQKLATAGADDRFLTGQSMLDFKNSNGRQPMTFSNVRQWLLPQFNIQKCIIATDRDVVRAVQRIDQQIIDGRAWINREVHTQGAALHHTVSTMMRWMNDRERDANSIYHCYCLDSGAC